MKAKSSQILFDYWNEVRRGRLAPRRFEIEPAQISPILAETLILERSEGSDYRIRLAGSRICEQFGQELRGSDLLEGWTGADREQLARELQVVSQQGAVAAIELAGLAAGDQSVRFELVLLPLVHTADTIDRYLGAMSALEAPVWLGHVKLVRRRLIRCDLIWPDGKPHAVVERSGRQAPFVPHIRNARLVRSQRRQFRVYDGGRTDRDS